MSKTSKNIASFLRIRYDLISKSKRDLCLGFNVSYVPEAKLSQSASQCSKKRINTHFRSVITDQTRRAQYETQELKNMILKSLFYSQPKNPVFEYGHFNVLNFTTLSNMSPKRHGSLTRIQNRCIVSGHAHTLKNLRLSRIQIRHQAGLGNIPGLTKF